MKRPVCIVGIFVVVASAACVTGCVQRAPTEPASKLPLSELVGHAFYLDGLRPSQCELGRDASSEIDESDAGIKNSELSDFKLTDIVTVTGEGLTKGSVGARIVTGLLAGQVWSFDRSCLGTPTTLPAGTLKALAKIPAVPIYDALPNDFKSGRALGLVGRLHTDANCSPTQEDEAAFLSRLAQGVDRPRKRGGGLVLAAKTKVRLIGFADQSSDLSVRVLSGPARGRRCWIFRLYFEYRRSARTSWIWRGR